MHLVQMISSADSALVRCASPFLVPPIVTGHQGLGTIGFLYTHMQCLRNGQLEGRV
jgi:hypothetical protein